MNNMEFQDYRKIRNTNIIEEIKDYITKNKEDIEKLVGSEICMNLALTHFPFSFKKNKGYNSIYVYIRLGNDIATKFLGALIFPIIFTKQMTKRQVFDITSTNKEIDYYIIGDYIFYPVTERVVATLICPSDWFQYIFSERYKPLTMNDTVYNVTNNNDFSDVDVIFESQSGDQLSTGYFHIEEGNKKVKIMSIKKVAIENNEKVSTDKKETSNNDYFSSLLRDIQNLFSFSTKKSEKMEKLKAD